MTAEKMNPSLQKKSAARTAAVQCLYTLSILDEKEIPADRIVEELKARLHNDRDEQKLLVGVPLEPNYALLKALLEGVRDHRDDINARLDGRLSAQWKRERMSPLLVAILQCSIFELGFGKEIKPKIVIDEYTRLARSFLGDAEADFVHGCLHNLVQ
jgi:transcription antitermination factor NusB